MKMTNFHIRFLLWRRRKRCLRGQNPQMFCGAKHPTLCTPKMSQNPQESQKDYL